MKKQDDNAKQVNEVSNQPIISESGLAPSSETRRRHTDHSEKPGGRTGINKSGLGTKPRGKSSGKRSGKG